MPTREELVRQNIDEPLTTCGRVVQWLEQTIEASLKRAERLGKAMLKLAFEGRLVKQDFHDIPAIKKAESKKAEQLELF